MSGIFSILCIKSQTNCVIARRRHFNRAILQLVAKQDDFAGAIKEDTAYLGSGCGLRGLWPHLG